MVTYGHRVRPWSARGLLAAYLVVLAILTLIPTVGPSVTGILVDAARALGAAGSAHTVEIVDTVTNVVLFVPAGLLVTAALPRLGPLVAWLICLASSVLVEVAQLFLPGRNATLADVATNGLGAAIGVLLHLAVSRGRATTR